MLLSVALAPAAVAQGLRPASLDSIPALRLDSVTGTATVYFRPAHRVRALEMHRLLVDSLAFFREEAGIESKMRVAVLDATDWGRLTKIPYGLPNNSGAPDNLLLAATSPPSRVGARSLPRGRAMDFLVIGHEGGHLLTWELMPDTLKYYAASDDSFPPDIVKRFATIGQIPGWYWEFAANYFTTAFLEAKYPADARAWRDHLADIAGVARPRFTHLGDWYGAVMLATTPDSTPYVLSNEGGVNQSWYQGVVALAAAHVHKQIGLGLVPHIRRMVSAEVSPTTQEIVQQLDEMAPGLIALLDRFGARYVAQRNAPR